MSRLILLPQTSEPCLQVTYYAVLELTKFATKATYPVTFTPDLGMATSFRLCQIETPSTLCFGLCVDENEGLVYTVFCTNNAYIIQLAASSIRVNLPSVLNHRTPARSVLSLYCCLWDSGSRSLRLYVLDHPLPFKWLPSSVSDFLP
ncbi:hypothetical protein BS17DRAFT_474102 [Gyrodon lividus]|nr:hypothetical protein BS17DRAFT_474102 [Gyrodon lividus]